MKQLGLQGFVVLPLLMVAIMPLIYGLKYQEDVRRGKMVGYDAGTQLKSHGRPALVRHLSLLAPVSAFRG